MERVIFALGVVVVAGLVVLIVAGRKDDAGAGHRARTLVQPVAAPTTTSAPMSSAAATTAPTRPSQAPRSFTLTLSARADSWFEIRAGSATGKVLYSGVLPLGRRRTFTGSRLWARFGGAANLEARLDGGVLTLPPGTYSAAISRGGLRRVSG